MNIVGSLNQLLQELKAGKAIVTNTDTVVGIIANNEDVIYRVKKRDRSKKIVRLISGFESIKDKIPEDLKSMVNKFGRGDVTFIFKQQSYRIPNHDTLNTILKKSRKPIYASSANISGKPVAKNIEEAMKMFEGNDEVMFWTEGEPGNSIASTIFDWDNWKVLRVGKVKKQYILS